MTTALLIASLIGTNAAWALWCQHVRTHTVRTDAQYADDVLTAATQLLHDDAYRVRMRCPRGNQCIPEVIP